MDRKEFLKKACGLGACGCVLTMWDPVEVVTAAQTQARDPRLVFARHQVATLIGLMAAAPTAPSCAAMLEGTGRECARLGGLAARFSGDPEGYFAAAKKNWGTEFVWNKEAGTVTVTGTEGECGCPLVDSTRTPSFFCNCSVGYQKASFEAVFGRPAQATLKASKLAGHPRCVFEVRLA